MQKQVSATTTNMCLHHERLQVEKNAGRKKSNYLISAYYWGLTISLLPSALHFLTFLLHAGLFCDVIGAFAWCGCSWSDLGSQAVVQEKGRANPDGVRRARWDRCPEAHPWLPTPPLPQGCFKGTAWPSRQLKHLTQYGFLLMVNLIAKVSRGKINNPPKISLLRLIILTGRCLFLCPP